MIHTFQMSFPIHHQEVAEFQRKSGVTYREINQYYYEYFRGVKSIVISNTPKGWRLSLTVDAIQALGKPNIEENDYDMMQGIIKDVLREILGHASSFRSHILKRIDYRYDVKNENKVERKLLLHLYSKQTRKYRYQSKKLGKVVDGKYEAYGTTVYHSSQSASAMVYLKEEERIANGEKPEWYEKDVIRYEVSLTNHLKDKVRVSKGNRPKQLKAYWKWELFTYYFTFYFSPIYYPCPYFKLDKAREIINSSTFTSNKKRRLIDFLKSVSSYDIDTALNSMKKPTLKKRISDLNEIGINPIPIPKNSPQAPNILANPLDDFPWHIEE